MSHAPTKTYAPSNHEFGDALCASPSIEPLRKLTNWFDANSDLDDRPLHLLTRLFDSIEPIDHIEAAKVCAACPMLVNGKCTLRLKAVRESVPDLRQLDCGPEGTWAAIHIAPRKKRGRPFRTDQGDAA